jgi:electron transfer flavoprotein beta subunit
MGIQSVTIAHVGLIGSEPTIRKALAIGADDAIRINSEPYDAYFVAAQLAEVLKNNPFDIILQFKRKKILPFIFQQILM